MLTKRALLRSEPRRNKLWQIVIPDEDKIHLEILNVNHSSPNDKNCVSTCHMKNLTFVQIQFRYSCMPFTPGHPRTDFASRKLSRKVLCSERSWTASGCVHLNFLGTLRVSWIFLQCRSWTRGAIHNGASNDSGP